MSRSPKINELKEDDLKFIQVYVGGEAYLRYSEYKKGRHSYHGFILEDFLREIKIDFETFEDKSGLGEIPLAKGEKYEIVGAGKVCYFNNEDLTFYDSSGSYHVGPNPEHLNEIFGDKAIIEKINSFKYHVRFGKFEESKNLEPSLKSKLIEEDDSDIFPF